MGGGENIRKCFICVGKALTIPPAEPLFNTLCNDFYNRSVLGRHFTNVHLNRLSDDNQTEYPICTGVILQDKMHLQNYAEVVHGLRTEKRYRME